MRSKLFRRMSVFGIGFLLLAGSLAASPLPRTASEPISASHNGDSQKEASRLLDEIKGLAYNLNRDADTLAVLAGSQVSWQSHADYLNSARGDINEMGQRLERLQAIKHATLPWQQQAIDRIVSVGAELANRTQAAINHLNDNRGFLFAESYKDHLGAISDRAGELKETVVKFVDFGQTQQRMERLQQQLEIAPS